MHSGSRAKLLTGIVASLVAFGPGCGKKKSSNTNEDNNGNTSSSGSGGTDAHKGPPVTMVGTLSVSSSLADGTTPDTVLAFKLLNGVPTGIDDMVKATIDSTGAFSMDLSRSDELVALRAAANDDGTIDSAKLSMAGVGVPADATQDQLHDLWQAQMDSLEKGGGETYVLVSMVSQGGDKVAEAKTFKFIGMASGKDNFINMPVNRAKASKIDLGAITTASNTDDAKSSVTADDKVFSMENSALAEMASTNAALKSVKNFYMNAGTDSSIIPGTSFTWNTKLTQSKNAWSVVDSGMTFLGYAFNLRTWQMPSITVDNLCHDGDTSIHKVLTLTPPSELISLLFDGTPADHYSPTTPLSNAGTDAITTEGDGTRVCNQASANVGKGGTFGARTNGTSGLYMGWGGGGGGFAGDIPTGFWPLVFDGSTIATFDFSAGKALDSNGKPTVYVPALKVTADSSTNAITKVEVKFYRYSRDAAAYEEVTDMTAFDRTVTDIAVSLDDMSGTTANGGKRIGDLWVSNWDGQNNLPLTRTNNEYIPDLSKATQGTWLFGDDASTTSPVGEVVRVSYDMYGSQYAFEFRNH